jgi:preprotein translocase SecE subunit
MSLTNVAENISSIFLLFTFFDMFKFLKDSIREFKHVVWPTHAETKKYFAIVVILLTLFGLYLFVANTVFAELMQTLRDVISGSTDVTIPEITVEDINVVTSTGETVVLEANTGALEAINTEASTAE